MLSSLLCPHRYENAMKFVNNIDVGPIREKTCGQADCFCATTSFKDTLMRIVANKTLFEHMEFPSADQQAHLFRQLKARDPSLYSTLDETRRTLFIRESGWFPI